MGSTREFDVMVGLAIYSEENPRELQYMAGRELSEIRRFDELHYSSSGKRLDGPLRKTSITVSLSVTPCRFLLLSNTVRNEVNKRQYYS